MQQQELLKIYSFMIASRESDLIESELVNSGEANFLASSRGHEGSAIVAPLLNASDWLHCHYRDKALMLARGMTNEMFFYSALCKAESHSAGRSDVRARRWPARRSTPRAPGPTARSASWCPFRRAARTTWWRGRWPNGCSSAWASRW